MRFKQVGLSLLTTVLILGGSLPAWAANQRSADFEAGHTLGVGLYGLSYDYGWGPISAGATAVTPYQSIYSPLNAPLNLGARVLGRFYQENGLSAGVLGALTFHPGQPGTRASLTPDLGLSVGYDFRPFDFPFALRLNLTLAIQDARITSIDSPTPAPNFFQRLGFGPSTSFEVAWMPSENFELTTGGGTLLGMRLKF